VLRRQALLPAALPREVAHAAQAVERRLAAARLRLGAHADPARCDPIAKFASIPHEGHRYDTIGITARSFVFNPLQKLFSGAPSTHSACRPLLCWL